MPFESSTSSDLAQHAAQQAAIFPEESMLREESVGILIVNGNRDPRSGKWIRFCLQKIHQNTEWPNFRVYVWNNNVDDPEVVAYLEGQSSLNVFHADAAETLAHPHAVPLQRLYEKARDDDCRYIVTLDSDAHPLDPSWLRTLVRALNESVVLAGVWRDELKDAIKPYIHPSCLCTTVQFIQENNLRLDHIAPNAAGVVHDTMSHFTEVAEKAGKDTYKLARSNRRNFHRLIGGIYGDVVYHHGAGSRHKVSFWDEPATLIQTWINEQISQIAANLLLMKHREFIDWLRGTRTAPAAIVLGAAKLHGLNLAGRALPAARRVLRPLKQQLRAWVPARAPANKARPLAQMIRPLGPNDLCAVPGNWQVKAPDFVGVGVPKAGTSWWCALLFEHPAIYGHRYWNERDHIDNKELCYFPHFGHRELTPTEIQTYRSIFAAPPGAISGEWSTNYFGYPHCLEHLQAAVPETKIIVMLRNPVDRTLSHINHLTNHRAKNFAFTAEEAYLFATYSLYPEAVFNSFYSYGIRRLLALYPRKQILVLQYERCKENPAAEIARTYRFLGVDDTFQPGQIAKEINKKQYSVARLSGAERARLADYFRTDVEETFQLLPELDRTLWPDFTV